MQPCSPVADHDDRCAAALVQFLGLVRWPFLVPYLARTDADPNASDARREAVDVIFQAFNRYLGVAVGEHLGDLFTGAWTTLLGLALVQTSVVPDWIGILGIVIGPILMLCALEFVGSHEPTGWKVAEKLTPVAYIAWSLWLIGTGVVLIIVTFKVSKLHLPQRHRGHGEQPQPFSVTSVPLWLNWPFSLDPSRVGVGEASAVVAMSACVRDDALTKRGETLGLSLARHRAYFRGE